MNNSLIPGFVKATIIVTLAYFPPPRLPPGYVPVHRPSRAAEAAMPAGGAAGGSSFVCWVGMLVEKRACSLLQLR